MHVIQGQYIDAYPTKAMYMGVSYRAEYSLYLHVTKGHYTHACSTAATYSCMFDESKLQMALQKLAPVDAVLFQQWHFCNEAKEAADLPVKDQDFLATYLQHSISM